MASSLLHPFRHCPFWSETSKKCRICQGGLFIPLDEHIETYCTTLSYPQCVQYTLENDHHQLQTDRKRDLSRNRRLLPRIEARWKITLVRLITTGTVVSHFSTLAETLDLSRGGMRLTTRKPLPDSSLLTFSFDHSFPKKLDDATGQVMWCNKEIDNPGYQAGVAFQEETTREAVAAYLDLHQPLQ
jgi:hypothetical protein